MRRDSPIAQDWAPFIAGASPSYRASSAAPLRSHARPLAGHASGASGLLQSGEAQRALSAAYDSSVLVGAVDSAVYSA
jgi:hypothetical protein